MPNQEKQSFLKELRGKAELDEKQALLQVRPAMTPAIFV